jgi:hypothetical protein
MTYPDFAPRREAEFYVRAAAFCRCPAVNPRRFGIADRVIAPFVSHGGGRKARVAVPVAGCNGTGMPVENIRSVDLFKSYSLQFVQFNS